MNIFNNYNLAGWASIGAAIMTIPAVALSMYIGFSEGIDAEKSFLLTAAEMLVNSIYLLMFVIVLINFKNLLNNDLGITKLDVIIQLIVGFNVVLTSLFNCQYAV